MHRKRCPRGSDRGSLEKDLPAAGTSPAAYRCCYDPATLIVAFDRVAGNRGANTAGVDGLTVADVEERVGVPGSWTICGPQLKDGHVPAAAGAGTQDPQAGRIGEAAEARDSRRWPTGSSRRR